jgi:hypothetical protein
MRARADEANLTLNSRRRVMSVKGISKLIYAAAALAAALSFTSSAFAINPQPEPPGIPAVVDSARKLAKMKQIKLPPDPCKLHYCR